MGLDVRELHPRKPIMASVALASLSTRIVPVNDTALSLDESDIDILYPCAGIRLLDGRITTLLEARALTLFATDTHIKSASWG